MSPGSGASPGTISAFQVPAMACGGHFRSSLSLGTLPVVGTAGLGNHATGIDEIVRNVDDDHGAVLEIVALRRHGMLPLLDDRRRGADWATPRSGRHAGPLPVRGAGEPAPQEI